MPPAGFRLSKKIVIVLAALILASITSLYGLVLLAGRGFWQSQSLNIEADLRVYAQYEQDLRTMILLLRYEKGFGVTEWALTDSLFDLLRTSAVASDSRQVRKWENAAQSPDRVAIALKWAEVAADEAAYHASVRRIWKLDIARNQAPHSITDDEAEPFQMPGDWTTDDLLRSSNPRPED